MADGTPADDPSKRDQASTDDSSGDGAIRLPRRRQSASEEAAASDAPGNPMPDEPGDRIVVPRRRPEFHPESQAEIYYGSKAGSRYARLTRARERRFERGDVAGTIRATEAAEAPRTPTGRLWRL